MTLNELTTRIINAIHALRTEISNYIITTAPAMFVLNGTDTKVIEDTVTPSNNTPLPVKITSTSGDINITAGDLNVQLSDIGVNYDSTRIGDGTNLLAVIAEDAAHTTGDTGIQLLAVRNDSGTSLVDTDGDYAPLSVDANGNLQIRPLVNTDIVTVELSAVDNAVLDTIAADTGTLVTGQQSDALTDTELRATPVPVSGIVTTNVVTPSNFGHIENTAISNITATQVNATTHPCIKCIVTASELNTGWIRFGGSTLTGTTGVLLYAGESMEIKITDTNTIYAIAEVNSEDIAVTYFII